ncbi:MAG: Uma2 family endonuclease [Pseudomonadota bacterium]
MNAAMNLRLMTQRQIFRKLDRIFGDGLDGFIAVQQPMFRMDEFNAREPDVTVMREPEPARDINRPDALLLAVEVSDTTLAQDRGPRRLAYARAGFPYYRIVDVKARQVEIHTRPENGEYREKRTVPYGTPIDVPGSDATISIE